MVTPPVDLVLYPDSMEVRVAPGLYPFMLAMFMCVLLLLIFFRSST